jgi:hypothetical protein
MTRQKVAPVEIYKVLKRALDNGTLDRDHLSSLAREISDLPLSTVEDEEATMAVVAAEMKDIANELDLKVVINGRIYPETP